MVQRSLSRSYPNRRTHRRAGPAARNTAIRGIAQRLMTAPEPQWKVGQCVQTPAGRLPVKDFTHSTFRGWLYSFMVTRLEPVKVNGHPVNGLLPCASLVAWTEAELLPLNTVKVMPVSVPMLPASVAVVEVEYQRPAGNQLTWFIQGAIS